MKTIEKIVDELTADNLEERKALLKKSYFINEVWYGTS